MDRRVPFWYSCIHSFTDPSRIKMNDLTLFVLTLYNLANVHMKMQVDSRRIDKREEDTLSGLSKTRSKGCRSNSSGFHDTRQGITPLIGSAGKGFAICNDEKHNRKMIEGHMQDLFLIDTVTINQGLSRN